jgi:hypothetical protein
LIDYFRKSEEGDGNVQSMPESTGDADIEARLAEERQKQAAARKELQLQIQMKVKRQ